MTSPTAFLKNIKKKVAIAATGATLLVMPGGIALAHAGHHGDDNHRFDSNNRSFNDNDGHHSWRGGTCEERQARADQAVADFKTKVQQHFNGLNIYLANQQSFVVNNNLSIDNYDELNVKAIDSQNNVTQALENIQAPTIDCDHSARHDRRQIRRAEQELRHAIKKYEAAVTKLSIVIAVNVKSS